MTLFRRFAFFTVARDASFVALAAGMLMVAFSFEPPLAFKIGATVALAFSIGLLLRSCLLTEERFLNSEAWRALRPDERPIGDRERHLARAQLEELLLRFAKASSGVAGILYVRRWCCRRAASRAGFDTVSSLPALGFYASIARGGSGGAMEEMRRIAYETVQRACLFGSLAIFCVMVGMSFEPRLAFQAGGTLTTMMAVVLIYKAREALTKDYKKTEMWLYLPKDFRPPEAYAQWASSTILRDTYLTFALWTSAIAIAMWAVALLMSLAGLTGSVLIAAYLRLPTNCRTISRLCGARRCSTR